MLDIALAIRTATNINNSVTVPQNAILFAATGKTLFDFDNFWSIVTIAQKSRVNTHLICCHAIPAQSVPPGLGCGVPLFHQNSSVLTGRLGSSMSNDKNKAQL